MDIHKPGVNKRVFAFLIDSLIASGIGLFLSVAGMKINWLVWIAYIIFRDCYNGRSIGNFCVNLQVINEEGKPANFVQSVTRNILMAIPVFPIIEYFVMMNNSMGRRIGDKLAKTQVNDLKPEDKESLYLILSIILAIIAALILTISSKK